MKTFVIDSTQQFAILTHPKILEIAGVGYNSPEGLKMADFDRVVCNHSGVMGVFFLKNVPAVRLVICDHVFKDNDGQLKKCVNLPPLESIIEDVVASLNNELEV